MTTASIDPAAVKYGRLFDAFDTDGDGYVEWADYQRLTDRYLSDQGIGKDDRRARALTACYQMLWMELLRHADGAERLTREQFIAALRAASFDTSRFNMIEGLPHAVFDILDSDCDNEIDRNEFAQLLKRLGAETPDAMERFTVMDTDGDGRISRQEFIRSAREFIYGHDLQHSPGSVAFGAV
ncbi:EF-hand domain-containing protein [Nocardiopsis ansamitocini]|uniref:Calcium-binding protein n=1 Tax=Nocardiopsis ansamitocini TaxID=1670832 RepID=A0A9W6PA77_9ACTN|nr:EF-hand domain-containing protein [Nocardiopsis ansamitocini]GLU49995.1 calcium-binding protein [Nocardiopsis ansamitocini]